MAVYEHTQGRGQDDVPDQPGGAGLARMTRIAGAAISLALLIGVGIWSYKLIARDVSGIPVVRAVEGPMRVQPENPGGSPARHQGLAVNAVAAVGSAEGPVDRLVLAPRPVDLTEEDAPMGELAALATPEEPATPAEAAQPGEPAASDPQPRAVDAEALAAFRAGSVDELVAQLAAAPAAGDHPLAAAPEAAEPEPVAEADATPAAEPEPDAEPATVAGPGPARSLRPQLRPTNAVFTAAPDATQAAAATAEVDPADLPAGTKLAQLGAFESAEVARSEWARLDDRFADYLAEKSRVIEKASSGGRTFYRLRAKGFDDIGEARRFCAALVAEGADCIPLTTR